MTDNNGKALREAKACLSDVKAFTHTEHRLKTALAALVDEIELAPVVSLWLGDADDQFVVDSPEEAQAIIDAGHRVRVLAVGEDG